MRATGRKLSSTLVILLLAAPAVAGVADPQLATDHLWYPGELACSTFDRLFATQAAVFRRVVGREPAGDEDMALASWLWRSTHYWHGAEGAEDWWARLDHDLGTIVFDPTGRRLLSAAEVSADWRRLTDRRFRPDRQHGWPVCGLDQGDAASYRQITSADYGPGYAGPPPVIHLRRG